MNTAPPESAVFAFRELTPAELDSLATISSIAFILGALAILVVLAVGVAVALRTKLPGRWPVLLSFICLASWWAIVQLFGGDLEIAFGPVGLLVSYTVYSGIAVVFSMGYLRMSLAHMKQFAAKAPKDEA